MGFIHLPDFRGSKGGALFTVAIAGIALFSLALFLSLVSMAIGGKQFHAAIGGEVGLAVVIIGLLASIVLSAIAIPGK